VGTDSLEYQVIAQWIAEGTKPPNPRERRIDHISIEPSSSKLSPKTHQQLLVTAHFNDGYVEDVTRWARFESTNSGTATVDEKGQVELKGSGEAAITAMYLSKVAVSTLVVPFANQIDPTVFSKAEQNNYIDQLVSEKLQTLNIAPSPLCTDSEFIRRAYLDTTGSLPPPDVAREFLANTKPGKRQELIEGLLKSQAYVDYWAYKWSDL